MLRADSIFLTGYSYVWPKYPSGKFLISLPCLKKKGDEADCLHADKYQTLLKLDLIALGGEDPVMPESPKITNLQNLCYISRKQWG